MKLILLLGLAVPFLLQAADTPPQTSITNGQVQATLCLPDAEHGYYRGSRFDWSGVIASLQYQGHNYFGVWFPHYDPRLHDAITGPVEEFRSEDGGLGYNEAKAGGTFVKIGVGVLRKTDDEPYMFVKPYEIVNGGKWKIHTAADHVEFTQTLTDASGYAYVYRKVVRLAKGKPTLLIEHSLKNTGKRTISTSVYNHDFFTVDSQPTSQDFTIKFAFPPQAKESKDQSKGFQEFTEIQGNNLHYQKELQTGQTAASYLEGYGSEASSNDIRLENRKTSAGVREYGDQPIEKLYLWSIRTTICPEVYVAMKIEPGKDFKWKTSYDFYTLSAATATK
jgi:hypothetical protein